jgi:single-strand DNA-binding protein
VVNFSVAVNDSYKPKGGERVKLTTYYNCGYWISEKIAEQLKKGTLVEVSGRIYVNAYSGADGNAKASLNCHVNTIKIHAWPKELEVIGKAVEAPERSNGTDEDLPF